MPPFIIIFSLIPENLALLNFLTHKFAIYECLIARSDINGLCAIKLFVDDPKSFITFAALLIHKLIDSILFRLPGCQIIQF